VIPKSGGYLEIAGIVEAWGRVHVHREGFRAQYARPLSLLLIGSERSSDYGRLVEDVAIAHRAGVLEVEGPDALEAHCDANGLGISRKTVESLIAGADPVSPRVD
jgi:hypothetical protein